MPNKRPPWWRPPIADDRRATIMRRIEMVTSGNPQLCHELSTEAERAMARSSSDLRRLEINLALAVRGEAVPFKQPGRRTVWLATKDAPP